MREVAKNAFFFLAVFILVLAIYVSAGLQFTVICGALLSWMLALHYCSDKGLEED